MISSATLADHVIKAVALRSLAFAQ